MAYRLCLLFCFLLAAAVAVVLAGRKPHPPPDKESPLREKLFSNSWVDRANAAIQLAENPHATPWLVATLDDEAPPVRRNALWALHHLTGAPWASRTADCEKWWDATKGATPAATWFQANGIEDKGSSFEGLRVTVRWEETALVAEFRNESGHPVLLHPGSAEDYTAVVFEKSGQPVGVIDPAEADAATVETRVLDEHARTLATWWWSVKDLALESGKSSSETYDLAALPPGRYVAETRVGPLSVERTGMGSSPGARCNGLHDTLTFTR